MIYSPAAQSAREEGFQSAKAGKSAHDNPYDYRFETAQAYAWDEGYKEGRK